MSTQPACRVASVGRADRVVSRRLRRRLHAALLCLDSDGDRDKVGRSGETEAVSAAARPTSTGDAVYFQLVRDVVDDFVTQFARGKPPR